MGEPNINFHVQVRLTQFKIPTELIKKNFKSLQKLIEKQRKQLSDEITKIKKNQALPTAVKLQMVKKLIGNFEQYQAKLDELIAFDEDYRDRLLARKEHLQKLTDFTVNKETEKSADEEEEGRDSRAESPVSLDTTNAGDKAREACSVSDGQLKLDLNNESLLDWYRDETNLLIIEYLIRSSPQVGGEGKGGNRGLLLLEGICEQNPGMRKLIDFDLYNEFNRVYTSIVVHHDLLKVTDWFNENKLMLKKINSNLEFEIKYCRLLSLIERNQVSEAIRFSQENLSMYGNKENYQELDLSMHKNNLNKLKKIGGLLLYLSINETNTFSSNLVINSDGFKEHSQLLSHGRWDSLAECFYQNFMTLFGIPKSYSLFVYLSAGLSSLKTKSCYCNMENTIFQPRKGEKETKEIPSINPFSDLPPISKRFRGPNQYYKVLSKVNNCPVCSPELFKLSQNLPYAQLITKIFNNPFKLPNGNIYPFDKLLQEDELDPEIEVIKGSKNALLRAGQIQDPLTKETFNVDDCIRVYPA